MKLLLLACLLIVSVAPHSDKGRLKIAFRVFDPTNALTYRQFALVVRGLEGVSSTYNPMRVFKRSDVDRSGDLDFTEFMKAYDRLRRTDVKEVIRRFFDIYDVDGDGQIEYREYRKTIRRMRPNAGSDVYLGADYNFEHVDLDDNGVITYDEYLLGVKQPPH